MTLSNTIAIVIIECEQSVLCPNEFRFFDKLMYNVIHFSRAILFHVITNPTLEGHEPKFQEKGNRNVTVYTHAAFRLYITTMPKFPVWH